MDYEKSYNSLKYYIIGINEHLESNKLKSIGTECKNQKMIIDLILRQIERIENETGKEVL